MNRLRRFVFEKQTASEPPADSSRPPPVVEGSTPYNPPRFNGSSGRERGSSPRRGSMVYLSRTGCPPTDEVHSDSCNKNEDTRHSQDQPSRGIFPTHTDPVVHHVAGAG
jgi:hypothetical protein